MIEWLAAHPILHGIGIGFGAGVSLACFANAIFLAHATVQEVAMTRAKAEPQEEKL